MDYYLYVGFHDAQEKSNFDRCLFFAVQVCGEEDDKVTQFYKEKSNGVLSTSWNSKNLINTIVRLCDWDLNPEFISSKWSIGSRTRLDAV